jgi:prevent-host-death family protein
MPPCAKLVSKLVSEPVIEEHEMNIWPVQNAKARFSELLSACMSDGPQVVTKRGAETAVLINITEWQRLKQVAKPSLKELLLAPAARADFPLPARGRGKRREATELL